MMGSGRGTGEDRARAAAEAAIRCPLLDDINLSGARGILVNITAGPDLGMDEFAAVGEAIGKFASEDALVVTGTALDESNEDDEVRVTVVATGLGRTEQPRAEQKVRSPVSPEPAGSAPESAAGNDYRRLDLPTVIRMQPKKPEPARVLEEDTDYLDIPAFLRRQAD